MIEGPQDGEDAAGADGGADPGVGSGPPTPPPAPAPQPSPAEHGPRRLRSLLIGTVIAAALAVFLFVGLGQNSGSGPAAAPVVGTGSVAPAFSLPSLMPGAPVSLLELGPARHRPVVLNFFASWCIPCQQETPLLARTATAERAKGSIVQFVGVDVADSPAQAVPFARQSGLTYPIGTDSTLRVAAVLYGLNGEPNTFFITGSGRVLGHVIGPVSPPQLAQWLHRLAG
ncbi:MAG TPA: TlpA disulfide reductase family protein, partial [Acidimicrobiales bacterium]|nr:TlpA disulfide reductase family protein [Acidimicrobiales bacterium]